jgi:hypothetical protein|tara:strand:+ start:2489 stop:2950 length:462 start_codon:yes stop_codon:yes gene_type:complete
MKPYPVLTHSFVNYLIKKDLSDKVLLELGSGKSTIFWADYFKKVYSYESDSNYLQKLKNEYEMPKNVQFFNVKDKSILEELNFLSHIKNSDYIIIDNFKTPITRFEYAHCIIVNKREDSQIILDNGTWNTECYTFLQNNFFVEIFLVQTVWNK